MISAKGIPSIHVKAYIYYKALPKYKQEISPVSYFVEVWSYFTEILPILFNW
jgi:hypothetical protein